MESTPAPLRRDGDRGFIPIHCTTSGSVTASAVIRSVVLQPIAAPSLPTPRMPSRSGWPVIVRSAVTSIHRGVQRHERAAFVCGHWRFWGSESWWEAGWRPRGASGAKPRPRRRATRRAASPRESRAAHAQTDTIRGWEKGKGWGWIWGKDDEVGSLNALSEPVAGGRAGAGDSRRGLRSRADL